jgi:hypothetical protein
VNHTEERTRDDLSRRRLIRVAAGTGLRLGGSAALATCTTTAPSAHEAPAARVYHIGWLVDGEPGSESPPLNWPSPVIPGTRRLVERLTELSWAAEYIDRILKGTLPGELPVQRTSRFDLYVNLCTAQALDLTRPPAFIARATEVIQ